MKKKSLCLISFLQALGTIGYCGLVGLVFWKGNDWFGKVSNYLGPLLVLSLFATSALVTAFLTLGYPAWLVWKKKEVEKALRVVGYTAVWLVGLVLVIMLVIKLKGGLS
jgi:hypothetical protein